MRPINLFIHNQSLSCLEESNSYQLNIYSKHETNDFSKTTRMEEEKDLQCLIHQLKQAISPTDWIVALDGFYWNYKIPRISKEFDLIRFGTEYLINVELKSKATEEKMREQLEKNLRYLKIMGKPVYQFTFTSTDKKLYTLDELGFHETNFDTLVEKLLNQDVDKNVNIDEVFSPLKYLISPFNNTMQFLNDEYFLTEHQEQIHRDIVKIDEKLHILFGKAGTGKSLLLYHLAKCLKEELHNTTVVHFGKLNEGHLTLREHGYNIYTIESFLEQMNDIKVDALLIDECQRIYKEQLEQIIHYAKKHNILCVLCVDPVQVFDEKAKNFNMEAYCLENGFVIHKLTDRIRYNPDISRFAKDVMNLREHHARIPSDHIQMIGISALEQLPDIVSLYQKSGYTWISYTDDMHLPRLEEKGNVHQVIGQEYNQVITFLDESFYYNENRQLCSNTVNQSTYLKPEMFYEAVTRARLNLVIVVIGNDTLFRQIVRLFDY